MKDLTRSGLRVILTGVGCRHWGQVALKLQRRLVSILIDLPSYFYLQVSARIMATLVWTFYQGQLDPSDNIYLEQRDGLYNIRVLLSLQ